MHINHTPGQSPELEAIGQSKINSMDPCSFLLCLLCVGSLSFCFVLAIFCLIGFCLFDFFLKEGREGDTFTEQGGRGVMYIGVEEDLSRDGKQENLIKIYFMKTTQTPGAGRAHVLAKDKL